MDDHDFKIVETDDKGDIAVLANELYKEVLSNDTWSFPSFGGSVLIDQESFGRLRRSVIGMARLLKFYADKDEKGVKDGRP